MHSQMSDTPAPSDDIFADLDTFETEIATPARAVSRAQPMSQGEAHAALYDEGAYVENCDKCRGTGLFHGMSRHGRKCFKCKGAGRFTFKTSPEQRAKAKASATARKARKGEQSQSAFATAHPAEAAWIEAKKATFGFAAAMAADVIKWGELSPGKFAAIGRCMAQDVARDEARAAREVAQAAELAAAPTMEMEKLEAAFDRAKASGLKRPKLRVAGFKFSPAPLTGKNAGAIYVKANNGDYLGKVTGGKFVRMFSTCTEETAAEVLAAGADPLAAAVAYGRKTGACACCGLELTNGESIARGIGPICAAKWGL